MNSIQNKAEYWRQTISEWRNSGETKKQFAATRGVSADAMGYWITKLKKKKTNRGAPADFIPVTITDPSDQSVTVHLSNGLSLSFAPGFPTGKVEAMPGKTP